MSSLLDPSLLADTARLRMAALLSPADRAAYLRNTSCTSRPAGPTQLSPTDMHMAPFLAAHTDLSLVQALHGLSVEDQVAAFESDPSVIPRLIGMPAFAISGSEASDSEASVEQAMFEPKSPSHRQLEAQANAPPPNLETLRTGLQGLLGCPVESNYGWSTASRPASSCSKSQASSKSLASKRSSATPTNATEIDAGSKANANFLNDGVTFVHLIDGVVSHLDRSSRLSLRRVSQLLCERVDRSFLKHLVVTAAGIESAHSDGGLVPRADFEKYVALRGIPRSITFQELPSNVLGLQLHLLTGVEVARAEQGCLGGLWPLRTPTAVISGIAAPLESQEWISAPAFPLPTLSHPTKIVYEIAFASTSLLLRAEPRAWSIGEQVTDLIIRLVPFEGELAPLPKRILYTTIDSLVIANVLDGTATPEVADNQELVVFDPPERRVFDCFPGPCPDPQTFFDKLAITFASSARSNLTFTIVGIERLGPAYFSAPMVNFDVKENMRQVMLSSLQQRGWKTKAARKALKNLRFVTEEEYRTSGLA